MNREYPFWAATESIQHIPLRRETGPEQQQKSGATSSSSTWSASDWPMVITGQRFPLTCYFRKLSNRRPEIGHTVFVVAAPKLFSIIHPITENEVPPSTVSVLEGRNQSNDGNNYGTPSTRTSRNQFEPHFRPPLQFETAIQMWSIFTLKRICSDCL